MAKVITNEVKTGLMVIICLTILAALTLSVGKLTLFKEVYKIKAIFNKVAGLEKDADVRLSGVEVGKVDSVRLLYQKDGKTKVLLTLLMDKDARLKKGAKAYVTTLGFMGDKYVELTPGEDGAPYLKAASTIIGEDPVGMEEIAEIAKGLADEAGEALNNISNLAEHLDEAIVGNRENIDDIMANLKRTTANFEEFSDDIKRNPWKLLIKGKEK